MRTSRADSKTAGQRNDNLVLALLRKHKSISQSRLCKLTGLASSTASYIVSRLRQQGLVLETRGQSSKRGPKPIMLQINNNGRYVVGCEIAPSHVRIGLFDFDGQIVDKIRVSLGGNKSVEHVVDLLTLNVLGIIGRHNIDQSKILGIGVTLSGSVSDDGVVYLSSPMSWKDVHLGRILAGHLSFPIKLYGTKVRLLAEIAVSPELAEKDILYLNVANGVGGTVYSNGRLMDGATGRCGEIGHIVVRRDGPQCGCGNTGCLESIISGPAIVSRIREDIAAGVKTILTELIPENEAAAEDMIQLWAKALEQGDEYSLQIREDVAVNLAKVAAIAVNCFDPDVIILGGYLCRQCPDYLIGAIKDTMRTDVYDNSLRNIDITTAKAGEDSLIIGVAKAILQDACEIKW